MRTTSSTRSIDSRRSERQLGIPASHTFLRRGRTESESPVIIFLTRGGGISIPTVFLSRSIENKIFFGRNGARPALKTLEIFETVPYFRMRNTARSRAASTPRGSTPRSNRYDESLVRPRRRDVARTVRGSK